MSPPESFSLIMQEFEKNISNTWHQLQKEEDFFDVTLACDDKHIDTHKVVISSFSPVLKNILKSNLNTKTVLYFRGTKYRDLLNLINFMYKGEINIVKEELENFLSLAKDLRVKGLCEKSKQNKKCVANKLDDTKQIISDDLDKLGDAIQNVIDDLDNIDDNKQNLSDDYKQVVHKDPSSSNQSANNEHDINFCKPNWHNNSQQTENELDTNKPNYYENDTMLQLKKGDIILEKYGEDALIKQNKEIYNETVADIPRNINLLKNNDNNLELNLGKSKLKSGNNSVENQNMYNYDVKTLNKNEENIFFCDKCGSVFTNNHTLSRHIVSMHEQIYHSCDMCTYKSRRLDNVKRHKKFRHEGAQFSCDQCEFTARTKSYLRGHIVKEHKKLSMYEEIYYSCDMCTFKSISHNNIMRHKKRAHEGVLVSFTCEECGFVASKKGSLKCHMVKEHNKSMPQEAHYSCDMCTFKSIRYSSIKRHKKCAHDGVLVNFTCKECGFVTSKKRSLKCHIVKEHKIQQ